ncbi:hypothetical protein MLD38_034308 [Melastoma candidum]|uniref:Uncharacterized protein n=1 Tax=Melastoma candidum TaxID=119954 RepID=A0ACB9MBU8_9MYRT|nr:hypothetical protein MLD38_034308 [Melastoma candidum]
MYPISWAVVEGENQNSWTWFIDLLFKQLNVGSGQGWTFISDQQKVCLYINSMLVIAISNVKCVIFQGLLNAISLLAPEAESRNCSRHIYQNWKVKHKGLFLKSCFYKAVRSTNEVDFQIAMREMTFGRDGVPGSVLAAEDFTKQGPHHFCMAFFKTTSKCGTHSNNMSETFNSYILAARRLPLIDMLERIRHLLMVRQVDKKKAAANRTDLLTKNVRENIESMKEGAGRFVVKPSLTEKFEVSLPLANSDRFIVDSGQR